MSTILSKGCTDPVLRLVQQQAQRIRFLERRLEHQLAVNAELDRARKAINLKIRALRKTTTDPKKTT